MRALPPVAPRITVITLAVDDLERAVAFYRDGLGWPTDGTIGAEFEDGAVAFFPLTGGLQLALWPRTSLAKDSGLPSGPSAPTERSLAYNVSEPPGVDLVFATAVAAGATPTKQPGPTFWGGYAGYFQDLDDHPWEVVFNPDLLPADGSPADSSWRDAHRRGDAYRRGDCPTGPTMPRAAWLRSRGR